MSQPSKHLSLTRGSVLPAWLVATVVLAVAVPVAAADLYVSPTGVSTNDGSKDRPLDLATALSLASPARPGDTIWLRGGTYVGIYTSRIQGTQAAPITVRQYAGERATLDGGGSRLDMLTVYGQWVVFWGFELTNSDPRRRATETGPWPYDLHRGAGIVAIGSNLKFINLIFHDLSYGIGVWTESVNSEVYGSVIYNNGWEAPDRGHGHGIYTQNRDGSRLIRENIVFNGFSHGIHAYGSEVAYLDNITLEGNVLFNNGILSTGGLQRDILLGGARAAQNPVLRENFTYGGGQSNLGYGAGCSNGLVENNYLVGSSALILVQCTPVMRYNTFYGLYAAQYGWGPLPIVPQNTYNRVRPTTNFITVRRNQYEAGRGHIVAYNWLRANSISVDLSPLQLAIGDQFEIRDAQNYFGQPVATGTYSGQPIIIPMTGLSFALPLGDVPVMPAHTAPEFGVFVVMRPQDPSQPQPQTVATPSFSPAGGTFTAPVSVSLTSSTPGATIRYTTDGSLPTTGSQSYSGPFTISATTTVQARAFASGLTPSNVATATFTVSQSQSAATPSIAPPGGAFTSPVSVSLATATAGAIVRYTLDGSDPTATSPPYAGPLTVSTATTLKARAFSATMLDSGVATAVFTFIPTAPTGLTAVTASASQINVNWNAVTGADGIRIERCSGAGCTAFSQIVEVASGVTAYSNGGLSPGGTYRFRVIAFNSGGPSAPSAVAEATTRPPAPGSLAVDLLGTQNVLRWIDTTGETGFRIERCVGAGCSAFTFLAQVGANVVTFADAALTPAAVHRYRVVAFNGGGDSVPSNVAETAPLPTGTANLTAATVNPTQISLAWAADAGATGYRIERCANAGCMSFSQIAQVGTVTTFVDSGLWSGVMYRYRVRAFNSSGPSGYSNTAEATTLPTAPRSLTITNSATGNLLRWIDSSNWETGLRIERCDGAGCTAFTTVGQVGGNGTSFADGSVTPSAVYRYRVFAFNAGGDSVASNVAEATTLPSAPTSLTAATASPTQIDVTWALVAGASGYRIERCATAGCTSFSQVGQVGAGVTTFANTGLWSNVLYRYRVRAFNAGGPSGYSNTADATTLPAGR